jgi:CRISPR-associated RAMP protein, csm5 family
MKSQYRIKLTTLTPVCIGDGNKINSITDCIYDRNRVYYLNKQKIAERLAGNEELMDRYMSGIVSNMNNNRTEFDLKYFLEKVLRLSQYDYTLYSIERKSKTNTSRSPYISGGKPQKQRKIEINTIIKNPDRNPYIPGTTLKGAIKTAFLYDWLLDKNNEWCKKYLQNMNNEEIEKALKEELEAEFDSYQLGIHDSSMFDFEKKCKIIENKRLSIKTLKTEILQSWECILEDKTCETQIWDVRKDNKTYSWEDICRVVNRYTIKQNDREKQLLEEASENSNIKYEDEDMKYHLIEFYEDMKAEIKNNPDCLFMRIGSGKGYFYNSVALALYDADDSRDKRNFKQLLEKSDYDKKGKKKSNLNPDEFPITRFIELSDNQPLGWVKLELK